ncbi:asparagine synthase (glutamine-hydrolyzing) [Myxococcota bacterium]|nr:asparagine synthase (glutamine-hydrolyzing) [Myxococcota bacterium]
MCGIAGIVSAQRTNIHAVRVMTDLMQYRGPDGEGSWTSDDGRCSLGHRRLAILDLSERGRQPMLDPELDLAITYNGEIYNYLELRDRLREMGHTFESDSDTEVLLRAYAQWGPDCLQELNGMFAFAIWDGRHRRLFCARDRFGEKPLYYAQTRDSVAFASEAKALARLKGVDLDIDPSVLASYLAEGSTRADANERTLVRGIHQLLPAHAMLVDVSKERAEILRVFRYWSVDVGARASYGSHESSEASAHFLELMRDSVRIRLRSDVPVGSCLSGGLDSSAVVCLIRELEPDADLRTFTGRFPNDPMDEGHYAKMVVDACRTDAYEVAPTPERFASEAERIYWHADFPIGGTSQFAQWCVFHLASRHGVTVLLDGQGSDEMLGGYGYDITASFLRQLWVQGQVRHWFRERAAAAREVPALFSWSRLLLNHPWLSPVRRLLRSGTGRPQMVLGDFFQEEVVRSAASDPLILAPEESAHDEHALSRILWTLSFRTMLSSLLRYGDRLSMAHSREVRLPFCDHRLAEFAFGLSPELLVGNGEVKQILRLAIENLVPPAIVTRPKQGFLPPQNGWVVGPLSDWIRDLADDPGPLDEHIDLRGVDRLVNEDAKTREREARTIWDLASLLAWSRYSLGPMQEAQKHSALAG